jgi:AraC-like DNA-binding protein
MLSDDHLHLRLSRLKPNAEWVPDEATLCFVFPKGGSGNCVCGLLTQPVQPGDVIVLKATSGTRLLGTKEREMVFWNFSICAEHLFPLFASSEIGLLQKVTENLGTVRVYPASTPVASECHRLVGEVSPQFDLSHRIQLLRIVVAVFALELKSVRNQSNESGGAKRHMLQVFERLSASDMLNLSVAELARKFGCSSRHLSRLFHEYFGLSVAALRMEMRLLTAVTLLRDPDAKVTNVANQCGFNHLGLFSTCFRRRFNLAPGEWRRTCSELCDPPEDRLGVNPACRLQSIGLCPWCREHKSPDYALLRNPEALTKPLQNNGSKYLPPGVQAGRKEYGR